MKYNRNQRNEEWEMNYFGITLGDPCGVGPEVTLKALKKEPKYQDRAILFGCLPILQYYNDKFDYGFSFRKIHAMEEVQPGVINVYDANPLPLEKIQIGKTTPEGGACAFLNVKAAIEFAKRKEIGCVVTAPLNKEAMHLAGYPFAGHTEIFAEYTEGKSYAMLLWSESLKTIHVTTHVSLRQACDLCKKERIIEVVKMADETLKKVGYDIPRIAVAGLNPHNGENGIFGTEELEEIIPAVKACKEMGINVEGPIPADSVFYKAKNGLYDIVVAMYHDQGHVPLKMMDFHKGVNITVGLDVVRTSVDHGTAFDIAGQGIANEGSMLEAIAIGEKL